MFTEYGHVGNLGHVSRTIYMIFFLFHGHHSYFKTDFQMMLAAKEGEILPPHLALGRI